MSLEPWKVLESTYIRPRFRVDKCALPNGKFLDATIFEFRSWANIVALTANNEAVLIKQYRHGVKEVLWEIPGGVVDDGEDPLEGVKRELLQETGYTASEFIQVGMLYPNPALQTNTMYCFLALNAEKVSGQSSTTVKISKSTWRHWMNWFQCCSAGNLFTPCRWRRCCRY